MVAVCNNNNSRNEMKVRVIIRARYLQRYVTKRTSEMQQFYLQLGTHQLRSDCFRVELRGDLLDSLDHRYSGYYLTNKEARSQ